MYYSSSSTPTPCRYLDNDVMCWTIHWCVDNVLNYTLMCW